MELNAMLLRVDELRNLAQRKHNEADEQGAYDCLQELKKLVIDQLDDMQPPVQGTFEAKDVA